jgi:hypothetical protein
MKDDSYIFEKHLDGLLEGDALSQFNERLNTDPDFARRFDLYKRLDEFIKKMHSNIYGIKKLNEKSSAPDIKEIENLEEDIEGYYLQVKDNSESNHLRKKLQDVYQDYKTIQVKRIRKSAILGIAASIAVLISLSVWLPGVLKSEVTNEQVFDEYYSAYPCVFNKRGVSAGESASWQLAINNYNKRDYAEALKDFISYSRFKPDNDIANLYIGICNIETANFDKALVNFTSITNKPYSIIHDQVLWYLGLTYLKSNNRPLAIKSFEAIKTDDCDIHTRATKILKELR